MIPYGKQFIDEEDIRYVTKVLRSDWLTTGPNVLEFEEALANNVGAKHATAFSNGTAALHSAMYALGIEPGDEVIVPAMTFAATANCVVYQGGVPVFTDVEPTTLLIDINKVEDKITKKTKAVIAVDYAGQPCEYDKLREITDRHGLYLIADACHALGAEYKGLKVGSLADMTIFSFHPVKHVTTGEGGAVLTNSDRFDGRLRLFRNHGINRDFKQREEEGDWYYEIVDLGYNYRITDLQCALGISQLKKLSNFLTRRREIAAYYSKALKGQTKVQPLAVLPEVLHAYHLYVVFFDFDKVGKNRKTLFQYFLQKKIRLNVHYIPVHLHPYYRKYFNTNAGICPIAENAYSQIVSLPIYPGLENSELEYVIETIETFLGE